MRIDNKGANSEAMSEQAIDKFYEDLFEGKIDVLKYGYSYSSSSHYYYFYPISIPKELYTYQITDYYKFITRCLNVKGVVKQLRTENLTEKLNQIEDAIEIGDKVRAKEFIEAARDLLVEDK